MSKEQYRKGEVIVREGDPGDCMYFVSWGKVAAYSGYGTIRQKKLAEISRGQFFGEMSLLDHEVRSATVVVLENETILDRITEDEFSSFMAENPSKIVDILGDLSHRLRTLTSDYVILCKEIESSPEGKLDKSELLRNVHDSIKAKA